jgi:hypothetical protein
MQDDEAVESIALERNVESHENLQFSESTDEENMEIDVDYNTDTDADVDLSIDSGGTTLNDVIYDKNGQTIFIVNSWKSSWNINYPIPVVIE